MSTHSATAGLANIRQLAERHREEREYLIEEYQFMRSFGMGHERACASIEQDPNSFADRLGKHGLRHITH